MLPTCTARVGQQAKGMVQHPGCSATLLSSMWTDGKGHHVYASYSSSGVLIKEDERKQEKYFITLMKKGNRSINVFLKRLWVIENLLRNLGV